MNPVFKQYAIILAVCLGFAGMVLVVLRLLKKPQPSIEATYLSWLIMVPLCAMTIWAGLVAIVFGILALSLVGFYEFARVTKLLEARSLSITAFVLIALTSLTALIPTDAGIGWLGLFQAMPAYCVAILLVIPILQNRCSGQFQPVCLAVVGYIYIGWMFTHAVWIAHSQHAANYLLYLCFAVGVTDISAFTFGKLFGRHLLRSNVSPKKTWEGSIGASAVAMAMPWLLRPTLPQVTSIHLLLIGVLIGVGAQLGDLAISVIKRDLQVKDTGDFIRGHGGMLDRIDSLIFVSPLYFHCLSYFELL
jgi:phosphatidate cytidylyltransferase